MYFVGLCDTVLTPIQVLDAIKSSVRVNATFIDKVVICLSGRIEKEHQMSIKNFMNWLKLRDYQNNVILVYTKCEGMDAGEKLEHLSGRT